MTFHQRKREISTHAPRTGSDGQIAALAVLTHLFQPTLPARGATCPARCPPDSGWYFNPRSPHGERRANLQGYNFNRRISTHAPRTGSDAAGRYRQTVRRHISTHAPRTGSDSPRAAVESARRNISTHAPRTGSDGLITAISAHGKISTHAPRTGSDLMAFDIETTRLISTHAPRTGSD